MPSLIGREQPAASQYQRIVEDRYRGYTGQHEREIPDKGTWLFLRPLSLS